MNDNQIVKFYHYYINGVTVFMVTMQLQRHASEKKIEILTQLAFDNNNKTLYLQAPFTALKVTLQGI